YYEEHLLVPTIQRCLAELTLDSPPDSAVRTDLMALSRKMMLRTAAAIIGLDGLEDPSIAERLGKYRDLLMAGTSVERRVGDHAGVLRIASQTKRRFAREFVAPAQRRRKTLVADWRAGSV